MMKALQQSCNGTASITDPKNLAEHSIRGREPSLQHTVFVQYPEQLLPRWELELSCLKGQ